MIDMSPNFDFMESFSTLCLVKSEKTAEKARYLALFQFQDTIQHYNRPPKLGQISCLCEISDI